RRTASVRMLLTASHVTTNSATVVASVIAGPITTSRVWSIATPRSASAAFHVYAVAAARPPMAAAAVVPAAAGRATSGSAVSAPMPHAPISTASGPKQSAAARP